MSKFKVYITDYDYPNNEIEKSILEPIGAEVIGLQCKDGKNIDKLAWDADALMDQYARISRETIEALPNLKVIARYGIGVDIVDVKAARERGVLCTNVMGYCTDEVADHNITLLLMLLRRIPGFVDKTRNGSWHWSETGHPVHRFKNQTVGIIGLGRIGRNMANKLFSFGFKIITYDPYLDNEVAKQIGIEKVSLEELCKRSDGIVLQCPYTPETHHIIGKEQFEIMNKEAVIVNCSRGKLIDNDALYFALKDGRISAAALDDIEDEPAKKFDWNPNMNKLFSLDNCFVTPHVAYYSEESLVDARVIASNNVKAVLLGQTPPNPVL